MRRGEIAISVVIVIALGLIVLMVLGVVLSGQFRNLTQTVDNCQEQWQGTCMSPSSCQAQNGRQVNADCGASTRQEASDDWLIETFPQGGTVCCVT